MGQAIGQILWLGVGVAINPVPIITVVLMLVTPRARVNAPAFVVGWIAGLALGTRAGAILDQLELWMARNNGVIVGVLCLIIGVTLVGDSISGLSS